MDAPPPNFRRYLTLVPVETGDGEKVIAIENLQNGTLTSDDLDAITINGEKITLDDSDEVTLTITNGELKTSAEEILNLENARKISGNETLKGGEVFVVEDTSAKVNITASKGNDTIVSAGDVRMEISDSATLTLEQIASTNIIADDSKYSANHTQSA